MNEMLDSRNKSILDLILASGRPVRMDEIAQTLHLSPRSIYYSIDKINQWMADNRMGSLKNIRGAGLTVVDNRTESASLKRLDPNQKPAEWSPNQKSSEWNPNRTDPRTDRKNEVSTGRTSDGPMETLPEAGWYVYSQQERAAVILCLILGEMTSVILANLQDACGVSRNTTLSDLKLVRAELARHGLVLASEPKTGYRASGSVIQKRSVIMNVLANHMHLIRRGLLPFLEKREMQRFLDGLAEVEKRIGIEYVDGATQQLSVLLAIAARSESRPEIIQDLHLQVTDTPEYRAVSEVFPFLPESERLYAAICLLGTRAVQESGRPVPNEGTQTVYDLANQLISEFERSACMEFHNRNDLLERLQEHLRVAMYRYRYGISMGNPLEEEIENQYPELFRLTERVAEWIPRRFGCVVNKGEIAYLAMHFGAHLRHSGNRRGVLRAVLVCPNGTATAKLLRKELEELVPYMEILDAVSLKELERYDGICDFIITTVDLPGRRKAIRVNPILTAVDRKNILSRILNEKGARSARLEADRIFAVISDSIPEAAREQVYGQLLEYYNLPHPVLRELGMRALPGLVDLLTKERIHWVQESMDWKDAIRLAVQPLVDDKTVDAEYAGAMIDCVEKFGSYVFITPRIALAHARPEDGVQALGMTMMICTSGIPFPGGNTADLLLVLAPEDDERHLRALQDLSEMFGENDLPDRILELTEPEAVRRLMMERIAAHARA